MAFTAWITAWYKVSGIQKQSTREVSNSAYWGQTMVAFSSNRIAASESPKEIFMIWLANPAKITQMLRIKSPTPI
jgi:hypothetical protein